MSRHPSALRIVIACFAASAAAAAPTLLLGWLAIFAFPIGLIIAGAHMVVIGLPAYLVLRRHRAVDWAEALIAGFAIGFVPLTSLQLMVAAYRMEWLQDDSFGVSLIVGGLGLMAGAVFRAVIGQPADPRSEREVASVFD